MKSRSKNNVWANMFTPRTPLEQRREEEKAMEGNKAVSVGVHIPDSVVDQLFLASQRLSSSAVVSFVEALCRVAKEELEAPQPRIFCLQKIVETSYFNMGIRGRIVWKRIWDAEGKLFVFGVCHKNMKVSSDLICIPNSRVADFGLICLGCHVCSRLASPVGTKILGEGRTWELSIPEGLPPAV